MLALGLKYQIYKNQRRTKQPHLTALFVPAHHGRLELDLYIHLLK